MPDRVTSNLLRWIYRHERVNRAAAGMRLVWIAAILVLATPSLAHARGHAVSHSAPAFRSAPVYRSAPVFRSAPVYRSAPIVRSSRPIASPNIQHQSFSRPTVSHVPTVQHVP